MMKRFLRRSFTIRIFATVLLVALLPLVLCNVVMLPLLIDRSENQREQQAAAQLTTAVDRAEALLDKMEEMTGALAKSPAVREALRGGPARDEKSLYEALFAAAADVYDYGHFYLYDQAGACRYAVNGAASSPALGTDWGILRKAAGTDTLVLALAQDAALLLARAAGDAGYAVAVMDAAHFDALFAGCYGTANSLLLLDAQGRMVYASQPAQGAVTAAELRERIWAGLPLSRNGSEFRFYAAPLRDTGFTLILQQPRAFTADVMRTFYFISGAMGLLCLLLCLWGGWVLSRHLAKPVRELSAAMGEAERGNLALRLPGGREDELGRLTDSFNRMMAEYQENLRRSVGRQKELNETRLRMMQAQLNPHFLYNTLDSMKWMGVAHQAPQVAELAADLASLLRASISGDEFVTLEQELELVERYIDIQSIRFEDRFTCEIAVGEEYQGCMVPKLVLQPLVENAVIHGVGDREDGYIKIWAESAGEELTLFVSDNGGGMPPELVAAVNRGDAREGGGHLGIYNVDSIIKLHFGDRYGLTAYSERGGGSRVSVRLPLRKKEAKEC